MEDSKEYLNLDGKDLKIDEIYFVELQNIFGVELQPERVGDFDRDPLPQTNGCFQCGYDLEKFQHTIYIRDISNFYFSNKTLANNLLLLKYIGDNQFIEYYSKLIIRYHDLSGMHSFIPENSWEFLERYKNAKKMPLHISKGYLLENSKMNRKCFYDATETQAKEIKEALLKANEICIKEMEEKLNNIMRQDEKYAYQENMLRVFVKKD